MSESVLSAGIHSYGSTHVARRKHNEDAFAIHQDIGLAIVADGVGGHHAGEIASGITCEVINQQMATGGTLEQAIRASNQAVMEAVQDGRGKEGMASTVVAAQFDGPEFHIEWVGDSRAYLWNGSLHLLTRDHSFVAAQLELGKITLEEARNHPRKNVIVQAIGLQHDASLRVGTSNGRLVAGETLLLCSDGLNDVLESPQIARILGSDASQAHKCEALVSATLAAGGRDNVTVVLVTADESVKGETPPLPSTVWSFDPVTGLYTGLPELDNKAISRPEVKRVTPKGLSSTQMMPVAQVEAMRKLAVEQDRKARGGKVAWAILAAILLIGTGVVLAKYLFDI
jgi:serine/threonine protein phosphatase PrpC